MGLRFCGWVGCSAPLAVILAVLAIYLTNTGVNHLQRFWTVLMLLYLQCRNIDKTYAHCSVWPGNLSCAPGNIRFPFFIQAYILALVTVFSYGLCYCTAQLLSWLGQPLATSSVFLSIIMGVMSLLNACSHTPSCTLMTNFADRFTISLGHFTSFCSWHCFLFYEFIHAFLGTLEY